MNKAILSNDDKKHIPIRKRNPIFILLSLKTQPNNVQSLAFPFL